MCAIGSQNIYANPQSNCQLSETYYLKREGSRILLTPVNSEIGQVSVTTHSISAIRGGEKLGTTISKRVNLDAMVVAPGVTDSVYELSTTAFLPDGIFVVLSAVDAGTNAYTKTVQRPVIGGSGKYAGARGTITVEPLKDSQTVEYKLTLNAEVFCKK